MEKCRHGRAGEVLAALRHGKRNWSWSWEIINRDPELATLLQNKIESATQKEVKLSPDELSDFDNMDALMGPPK